MAKKAPAKPAAKRKPRAKKPVPSPNTISVADEFPKSSILWRTRLISAAKGGGKAAIALTLGISMIFGPFGIAHVWQNWGSGLIDISPNPKIDAVSKVFDTQESEFRKANGELAKKLMAGEFASEKDAERWMSDRYKPEAEKAWFPLLEEHFAAYGGENWTAEKQAKTIGRYAR